MGEIRTKKKINFGQFSEELGGDDLRIIGPSDDGEWRIKALNLSDKKLKSAIESHIVDVNWIAPLNRKAADQIILKNHLDEYLSHPNPSSEQTSLVVKELIKALYGKEK